MSDAWIPVIIAIIAAISGWIPLILQRRKNTADIASVLTRSSIDLVNEKDESIVALKNQVNELETRVQSLKEELAGAYRTIRAQQRHIEEQDNKITVLSQELAALRRQMNGGVTP